MTRSSQSGTLDSACARPFLSGMAATDIDTLRAQLRDRYKIERELGRGGMGTVYLARELGLDRLVALKVLPSLVAGDAGLRARFLQETRTAASFSHPNIVPVHAVEEHGDLLAFAMGFVEGESLAERVKRTGPLASREAVRLMLDVAYALSYAHGRGVVHRDIKPDNIMIERATGRALVMDFGISRRIDAVPAASGGLTRVGEVVGTPEYMSPEQASGDAVDGRSDLYSLGLVAWFALSGQTAVTGENTQKVLVKQLTETLPPLSSARPDVPAALAAAVDRCVAKEPSARYADANALVEALEAAQQAAPEIPVVIRLLAGELGTLLLLVAFAVAMLFVMLSAANEVGFQRLDNLVPVVLLVAVVITRALQTKVEVARVVRLGFPVADLRRTLTAVVDEAQEMRTTRAADSAVRDARARTIRRAVIQIAVGSALMGTMYVLRERNGMGGWRVGPLAATLGFTGLSLLGVSLVLLLRSPFRMPPGERVFRKLWLGTPGRWFFTWAARGVSTGSGIGALPPREMASARTPALPKSGASNVVAPAIPAPRASAAPSDASREALTALESRVQSLELWRDTQH